MRIGYKHSEETKRKIGEANKNSIKKLWQNLEYRKHMSEVHKGQISANKGKHIQFNTGRTHFSKGHTPWNKNKNLSNRNYFLMGENNPRWKGGHSSKYKKEYHKRNYIEWRRSIFIRDKFTCQKCKKMHVYITAHHIKSWVRHPECRYDLDNGLTLCEGCHRETDNYGGRVRKKQGI